MLKIMPINSRLNSDKRKPTTTPVSLSSNSLQSHTITLYPSVSPYTQVSLQQ